MLLLPVLIALEAVPGREPPVSARVRDLLRDLLRFLTSVWECEEMEEMLGTDWSWGGDCGGDMGACIFVEVSCTCGCDGGAT